MSSPRPLQALKDFGLDDKEAAVYLAGLQLGTASVQRLAAKSRIKRTTVYLVAEALKDKGLFSSVQSKRGIEYLPLRPDRLPGLIEARAATVQDALPELLALTKERAGKPNARYFEGREGLIAMLNEVMDGEGGELQFIGSYSDVYTYASPSYYAKVFLPERLRRKIFMRGLVLKEPRSMALRSQDGVRMMRELRYLPPGTDIVSSQYVYRDRIAYISPGEEAMGLLVESRDLAALERQKFELCWEACRP
ncbi:hypothetical protein L0Y59_01515 [Candidatus Uhrbacteria bacterium]|nr:hypothetical protein [Candidatus Uhrbacteria bacterium]